MIVYNYILDIDVKKRDWRILRHFWLLTRVASHVGRVRSF